MAIVRVIVPVMFLIWIISALKSKRILLQKNKITCLFLIFLALAVFSLFFSHNLSWSLRKLFFLLSLAPLYFVAVSIFSEKCKQRAVIIALVGGTAAIAFVGIIQFISQFFFGIDSVYSFLAKSIAPLFLGNSFSQAVLAYPSWLVNSNNNTYMRAIAVFPDPHMFSYYLGMLAPWSVALWATTKSHKKVFFFSSLLIILADILTFTRGGYIALIASALIILPLVSKNTARKLIAGILMFVCLLAIVPHTPVTGRFVSSFDTQEGSNQARISNWQQALKIISAHPFGVGIGMYSLAVDSSADYRKPIYAHNLYLDIAGELGIFSALIFISLLFFVFKFFWKNSRGQAFFIAGVASITLFGVHSLVESPLYSVHVLPLFLIIIALSAATKQHKHE